MSSLTPPHPLRAQVFEQIWTEAARLLGFSVVRSAAAYASTDGRGNIVVGTPKTLDADDSVAQLIFHELCHALIEGEACWSRPDWGLDNTSDRDDVRERACLRLQAHLADGHGLRELMTPTTEWRAYYTALGADPLRESCLLDSRLNEPNDEAMKLAFSGAALASSSRASAALQGALAATAAAVRDAEGLSRHPLGFALGASGESCGSCAWRYRGGRGPAVDRCRQSDPTGEANRRVEIGFPACDRWEPPVDCLTCGACCREAYHMVSVSLRDPVVWKQPKMIVRDGHRFSLLRSGDRCAALEASSAAAAPLHPVRYACRMYEDRPQTCRDFAQGGAHCLTARRRVGLSR